MAYNIRQCALIRKSQPQPGIYDFLIQNDELARLAQPGQFVHILIPGKTLRRPISICDADPDAGTLRLVFEVRGDGTRLLSLARPGDDLDLLAPLGHGFALGDPSERAVFVGGGIGVPPLLFAARHYGSRATVLLGFRNRDAVILYEDFANAGCEVELHTDDGSAGRHGLVTAGLENALRRPVDRVYACGPLPMLKAVARLTEQYGVPCQVSLEERMGCGVGACLVCACGIKTTNGTEYRHVCKDGPVFDAKEVAWE